MTRGHYYSEWDPYAAQWIRNLIKAGHIPAGDVDERSITEVQPDDLHGYVQCHFFAGIAGWAYALRLAGWPEDREVWTGSCPCQPFSVAGKQAGFADERHLWPVWFNLIRERRPAVVFGEQVASAKLWLDGVYADLEAASYAVGSAVLPACAVNAPHRRNWLFFVAHTASLGWGERRARGPARVDQGVQNSTSALADADSIAPLRPSVARAQCNPWSAEPEVGRVVDGVSHKLVEGELRGFGNAIVPQVAAEFIAAYMECEP